MRLLHFNALSRLVLTDFRGKRIPPYAILSHRWSDSEILIEDITSETYKKKEEGYKKLMFCARQAAHDKLQYFWIDTCCIDRWNNYERSRAINSMFQWYKNATRCYVFMSDVSVPTATELVQRSDWEASFRASAWFTRGWTLQELIAPLSVEFFSREGLRIGDKTSLDQLLHTITSIPLAALHNSTLNQYNIYERMRWAENRVTTEKEDIAYCLLGLLGVSMPASYGEGQESALERLRFFIEQDKDQLEDDDRMSVQSIDSSTTLVSTFSDSTIVARSATVELERVFQEDEELNDLYRLALKDTSMEPERLQRNVSRLLQLFAKDLRREAGGQLERLASRFVQSKAQYIAHCIVERFNDTPRGVPHQQTTSYEEEEGHEKTQLEGFEAQHQVNNEQVELDEVEEEAPIDEDFFDDLAMLRIFLVRSSAFQIFRARLTKFVIPKDSYRLDVDSMNERSTEAPSSNTRCLLFSTSNIFKTFLVMVGCLEPPLQPGFIRLRWHCECGAPLFGDVQEYRIGGISKLIERMEKSTGGKVTATSYNKESPNQQYTPGPILWFREMARNMTKAFSRDGKCSDTLPQHHDPRITVTPASPNIESPPTRDLLLLACMHESQGGQLLRQDSIGTMSNDRQLFCFIREQISQAPSKRWLSRLLKTVTGIHFTQFHLRLNDDVEPRLHKLCCRQDACQCVPLTSNAEYDCTPAGPLDFGPPVLPSKMLHYFKHPDHISEKEMSILNQLPKRNCGKLQSTGQAPAEGWGLYYEENWNVGLMVVAFVGMTICASLAFGVWWTLARADIQGAWGVSSYMITACALVLGLVSIVGRASGE